MTFFKLFNCALFFLFSFALFSQNETIDSKTRKIDSLLNIKALEEKVFPQMSFCGGNLKCYYFHHELVLFHTVKSGPNGFSDTKWYIENQKLIKSVEFGFEYQEPENLDEYCKTHQTPDHQCDFSGLSAKTYRSVFYHSKKTKTFNKVENNEPIELTTQQQKAEAKTILLCFKSLLKESKQL